MKQLFSIMFILAFFLPTEVATAHCDSMKGPVVAAARQALESGDVTLVLRWVRAQDEQAIREAFRKTLEVRRTSAAAKELADKYFFETLVRVHRAGEGAPYTGLKSADVPFEPGVEEADKALKSGDLMALMRGLHGILESGLKSRHDRVVETRNQADGSVASGRAYVAAYVDFLHYAEGLFKAAGAKGHAPAEGGAEHHDH